MRASILAAACAAALGCGGSSGYGSSTPAPAQCTAATATQVTGAIALSGLAFVPSCAKLAAGTTAQ
jgi:hypothetical protein